MTRRTSPLTDPSLQDYCTRFLKPYSPAPLGNPSTRDARKQQWMTAKKPSVAFPVQGLAPSPPVQPSFPDTANFPIIPPQTSIVRRSSVVLVVPPELPIEGLALFLDRIMTVLPAPRRHCFQAAFEPLPHGPNVDREVPPPAPRTDVREAEDMFYRTCPRICVLCAYVAQRNIDAKI